MNKFIILIIIILFSGCKTHKETLKTNELVVNVSDSTFKEDLIKQSVYTINIKEEFDSVGKINIRNIEYKGLDNIKQTVDKTVFKAATESKSLETAESTSEPKPLLDKVEMVLLIIIILAVYYFKK